MLALNQQQLVFVPIPNLLFRPETKAELEIPTFRPFFPAIEHDFLNEFGRRRKFKKNSNLHASPFFFCEKHKKTQMRFYSCHDQTPTAIYLNDLRHKQTNIKQTNIKQTMILPSYQ